MITDDEVDSAGVRQPVRITNEAGRGGFVIVCEHASNWLPEAFGRLGLAEADMVRHIAWDPGALPVARILAQRLDSPLVESRVSRLAIDCNRPLDAVDLVPAVSETTIVPGNGGLTPDEREARIAMSHAPFHEALSGLIGRRMAAGEPPAIITIHSFTPVYKGVSRPWHVGVIHDDDERLSHRIVAGLGLVPDITIGDNEPYSPADSVYYTLERHARPLGLPCAMIEIRNDEIADPASQKLWAGRLAIILSGTKEPDMSLGVEAARSTKGDARRA